MKEHNQKIKCQVYECKYCDAKDNLCNLESISINSCNYKDCNFKEETMCASFKRK